MSSVMPAGSLGDAGRIKEWVSQKGDHSPDVRVPHRAPENRQASIAGNENGPREAARLHLRWYGAGDYSTVPASAGVPPSSSSSE